MNEREREREKRREGRERGGREEREGERRGGKEREAAHGIPQVTISDYTTIRVYIGRICTLWHPACC